MSKHLFQVCAALSLFFGCAQPMQVCVEKQNGSHCCATGVRDPTDEFVWKTQRFALLCPLFATEFYINTAKRFPDERL